MDHIKIEGIPGLDGEHPLDVSYFTNRELHIIKEVSGVRAGHLDEAFDAGDTDLMVALAMIALRRGGKRDVPVDVIWDAPMGSVVFVADDEEEATNADPPAQPPTENVGGNEESEKPISSGGSLRPAGDRQESDLSRTGSQSSAVPAASAPTT